ncbi:hypothetical protein M0813_20147 [Anaeramoeba flamelloides]|uniref:B box-type domain-containing protein n=1 Tax=Anaeramoeba flamelloides TaxID=1746091 RepID=A0ABQ8YMG4_9EUKA|nr:hypothetical protein M0813_20147 [Anaeramoeba flamelloides]
MMYPIQLITNEDVGSNFPTNHETKDHCWVCKNDLIKYYCPLCKIQICEKCNTELHPTEYITNFHKVQLVSDLRKTKPYCQDHVQEMEFYCKKDNKFVCKKCDCTLVHKDSIISMKNSNDFFLKTLQTNFPSVNKISKQNQKNIIYIEKQLDHINKNYKLEIERLVEEKKNIKNLINQLIASKIDQINDSLKHKIKFLTPLLKERKKLSKKLKQNLLENEKLTQEIEKLQQFPILYLNYSQNIQNSNNFIQYQKTIPQNVSVPSTFEKRFSFDRIKKQIQKNMSGEDNELLKKKVKKIQIPQNPTLFRSIFVEKGVEVGNNCRTIKFKKGNYAVGDTIYYKGIHYIKLKMNKIAKPFKNTNYIQIGVINSSKRSNCIQGRDLLTKNDLYWIETYWDNGLSSYKGKGNIYKLKDLKIEWGNPIETNDIITIKLDMDKKKMSIMHNQKDFGVVWKMLPDTVSLFIQTRAFLAFGNQITLID